jgi:hypothetical protein
VCGRQVIPDNWVRGKNSTSESSSRRGRKRIQQAANTFGREHSERTVGAERHVHLTFTAYSLGMTDQQFAPVHELDHKRAEGTTPTK